MGRKEKGEKAVTKMDYIKNPNGHCRLCQNNDEWSKQITCESCDRWFHMVCLDIKKEVKNYICPKCAEEEKEKENYREALSQTKKLLEQYKRDREVAEEQNRKADQEIKRLQETLLNEEQDEVDLTNNKQLDDSINKDIKQLSDTIEKMNDTFSLNPRKHLIELPDFNGDFRMWPQFKMTYLETARKGKFSNLENLNRIRKHLKGDALKSVQGLMLNPDNVDKVFERLNSLYGNPDNIYTSLLNELLAIRYVSLENPSTFMEFSNALHNLIDNMTILEQPDYLNDQRLLKDLVSKLPLDIRNKWYLEQLATEEHSRPVKTLKDLAVWLKPTEGLATMLIARQGGYKKKVHHLNSHMSPQKIRHDNRKRCLLCDNDHKTVECRRLTEATVSQRRRLLIEKNICQNCCNFSNHKAINCFLPPQCKFRACRQKHNTLLHQENDNSPGTPMRVNCHNANDNLFYQIIPVTLHNQKTTVSTYALIDPGSSTSLILEEVRKQLGAQGEVKPLTLSWTNGSIQSEPASKVVSLKIQGPNGRRFDVKNLRSVQELDLPMQSINARTLKRQYKHLNNINLQGYLNAIPTVLLGLPHSYITHAIDSRSGKENEPIAQKSRLGWVLFGGRNTSPQTSPLFTVTEKKNEEDKTLRDLMRGFFSTEEFGVKANTEMVSSRADNHALEIMRRTCKKLEKGYEIGLLWKSNTPTLPDSYQQALTRLKTLERKIDTDPKIKEWYHNEIASYVKKGYARKASTYELLETKGNINYIPHFFVINYNKPVPKPRLVFDAAAQNKGISLNSQLYAGPDGTTPIFGVLTRFRENEIGCSGDIREMFHQVKIREQDQSAQRFLYRSTPTEVPQVYVMQAMIFGATCSPACAQFIKNENALKYIDKYPDAVNAICNNHYVDDYLDSFSCPETAIETIKTVCQIHDEANFFIRNFVSNSKEVLRGIPDDRRSQENLMKIEDKEQHFEKVLGMYWDTNSDTFRYKLKNIPTGLFSKREMLSFIMRIYDPVGLIANIVIEGKVLMQRLWKAGVDWDDNVPEFEMQNWTKFLNRIRSIENIHIPRCFSKTKHVVSREIHTFVDASEDAFAAVAYMKTVHEDGVDINIIAAKTRVAPTKPLSIPRLELQAAVLGIRLAATIRKELRLKIDREYYWSDSKTVLAWIRSEPRNYKQFVALRIGEILQESSADQWHWVASKDNPADEATKVNHNPSIWLTGPAFLHLGATVTPNTQVMVTFEEVRPVHTIRAIEKTDWGCINVDWCSDWNRLKRSLAIGLKFMDYLRAKVNSTNFSNVISKEDLDRAERQLLRKAQWEGYPEEMISLHAKGIIKNDSKIRNLTPQLDDQQIMRSVTRLEKANFLHTETKNPIILPKKHTITKLIVKHYHEKYKHKKTETIIAAIRQRFWIIDLRAVVKNVVDKCQKCKNDKARPSPPIMAPLPRCRLAVRQKPFTHTGVDYFGPLNIAIGRRSEKRWGAVFTCLTTRAVHIELATDLSASSFIICLKNMQHRRGKVSHIYSDNGTNFVGANNEMTRLQERCATEGIDWHFNPPSAPHFGGAWERVVKEIKSLLPMEETYKEEVLRTVLTEIEFMINNRPLTHIPLDREDEEALTPAHFLLGHSGEAEPNIGDISKAEATRSNWKKAQAITAHYWNRWITEYLPKLGKREKWFNKAEQIQVGDVVTFPDDQRKGKWLKGRVTKVNPGKDNQVRSACVKIGNTEVTRPTVKLAVLEVKGNRNFPNWGKRPSTDSEFIRDKANELKGVPHKRPKQKIRPVVWKIA